MINAVPKESQFGSHKRHIYVHQKILYHGLIREPLFQLRSSLVLS